MIVGWHVRVATDETDDGVYNTLICIAGFPTPAEEPAEEAVRKVRSKPNAQYEVLAGEIIPGEGPQPKFREVCFLPGAK